MVWCLVIAGASMVVWVLARVVVWVLLLRALGRVERDEKGRPGRHLLRRQGISGSVLLQFFVGLVG